VRVGGTLARIPTSRIGRPAHLSPLQVLVVGRDNELVEHLSVKSVGQRQALGYDWVNLALAQQLE
jgi:hypothetical protein